MKKSRAWCTTSSLVKLLTFTGLGDVNDDLLVLEPEGEHPLTAKQVLVLMVQGTMFNLQFPYALLCGKLFINMRAVDCRSYH